MLFRHSLVGSADRDSQDNNLVGLLDRFAKTANSHMHDSVDFLFLPMCTAYLVLIAMIHA